ncbi:hypothetical protein [Cohnella sp.]|uniref:hypothetical protein n=1 Tax=Cohnella sp. TaxID=1883426 RepID=UPI0035631A6A
MAELTSNIGLKKPLESEFVSINTLNENMDIIDQALGPMGELPTEEKNAVGAISELYDHLAAKPSNQLTLKQGAQIVQGGEVPAILHPTMQGQTLVNLLGKLGNMESLGVLYQSANATSTLDVVNYLVGSNSVKYTSNANGAMSAYLSTESGKFALPNPTKYYLAVACFKNGTVANGAYLVAQAVGASLNKTGNRIKSTTQFLESYATILPSDLTGMTAFRMYAYADSTTLAGQYAYVDAMRLYEITAAEKTYIDGLTTAEAQVYIAAKYPYVDDMKHVNAVYIENKGMNLLPPFSEWTLHANAVVTDAYSFTLSGATSSSELNSLYDIPAVSGQSYTFSAGSGNGYYRIGYLDANKTAVQTATDVNAGGTVTITAPTGVVYLRFNANNTYPNGTFNAGTFTFTNPMLNIGSEALPFEPQKPSFLYLPDCNLRSNVDGSVGDRLYTDGQGKPRVTRRFREMVLDGTMSWGAWTDYTGYKRVRVPVTSAIPNTGVSVKYDGKIIAYVADGQPAPSADTQAISSDGYAYISIADTDSGWGETYTPTVDEIKAYFNGWKMYAWDTGSASNPYTGSGTKGWIPIMGGTTVKDNVPTYYAQGNATFLPYRLMYQLAQSVDKPVSYEGSLMLHEGDNQVEVETGIVVREAARASYNAVSKVYWINGSSNFPIKFRPTRMLSVYRNQVIDRWKFLTQSSAVLGPAYAETPESLYDPSATYSVTYRALDTYALGIAPQTISAEYAPNIRESVDSLARGLTETKTQLSVMQNVKAQKQQPQWIAPTLMSGWVNAVDEEPAGYYKDDSGVVRIRGTIAGGVTNASTQLFVLPNGYRPAYSLYYSSSYNGVSISLRISAVSGTVFFMSGVTAVIPLSFSFRAEQ